MGTQAMLLAYGATAGGGSDPNWANVQALLHMDGSNGSTTFTDETGKTWTGSAQLSTAQQKFGTASGIANGSQKECTSAGFSCGTGDFTIEFFYQPNVASSFGSVLDNRFGGYGSDLVIYGQNSVGYLTLYAAGGNRIDTAALTSGTWYHIALSRVSGVTKLFTDGVQSGSNYTDTNNYTQQTFRWFLNNGGASPLNGYIDEARITVGVGRYSANFTPPSAAFPNS